jgi:predicted amidophosphoribosyltransferase
MPSLHDFLYAAGDLLMPRSCLVCGTRLGLRERHLCLSCAADLPFTRHWLQAHNPLADRFNAVLERHRGDEPMDYAYAAALLFYKGDYRRIPQAVKYQGNLAAGRWFGAMLGRRLAAAPPFADVDLIIPVPLHWTRRWRRGYNQAEILAKAVAEAFAPTVATPSRRWPIKSAMTGGVPVTKGAPVTKNVIPGSTGNPAVCRTDLLVRTRRTRTQTRLDVEQKARNVEAAFHVPERLAWDLHVKRSGSGTTPRAILASARHILLIDDTFTTGATLYACYAALRPYTSARISVATLAAVEGTPSLPHERPSGSAISPSAPTLSPFAPAGTHEPTKTT